MRNYIAEFIGTFAMIFCGTGAIIVNQEANGAITHLGISIIFGLIVMSMIYALGNISGAHFNPAVTIAFTVAKKFQAKQVLPYIISQLLGAVLASATLYFLFPKNEMLGATLPTGTELQAFVLEFIITFILMFVILCVAHGSKEQGMFAGIAIGSAVLLLALFAGPICGASMNPARSFAPALISNHLEHIWVYIVAPIFGAISSVFIWKYINENEEIKIN
ncbi:MIP family channel protein [Flavobacterium sp.]|uniref:MIP/aquaporin family protein n=1 Tax=Flavobacterium sp. TaxID=239 RepID=UPI00286E1AD4|nr:MIP family channel protein [Flavobacterium sp.]